MLCSSQSIKSGSRPCPRVWFPGQRMSDIASSIVYKFTVQLINQPVWRYFKIMQILCSPQNIPLDLNQLMILSWINISWDVRKMLNLPTAVSLFTFASCTESSYRSKRPPLSPSYLLIIGVDSWIYNDLCVIILMTFSGSWVFVTCPHLSFQHILAFW